jgi:transposase
MGLHDKHKDMTMMTDNSIGVDISKDFLDAHRLNDGTVARFENHPPVSPYRHGWAMACQPDVVFEATGAYHRSFERAFFGQNPW